MPQNRGSSTHLTFGLKLSFLILHKEIFYFRINLKLGIDQVGIEPVCPYYLLHSSIIIIDFFFRYGHSHTV